MNTIQNQETTWKGHSTIIHEVKEQLESEFDIKDEPQAVVTCVGGGGLAIGKYSQTEPQ